MEGERPGAFVLSVLGRGRRTKRGGIHGGVRARRMMVKVGVGKVIGQSQR